MLPGMTERGIGLAATTPPEIVAAAATQAEELGYRSFWLNHPGGRRDGVAALAPVAAGTRSIDLGVGVVPLHLRPVESVVETALAESLPAARLVLGIGTYGPGAFHLAREGAARLRERLGCRVAMAALSERTCRVAGEIGDAVLFNWLTPEHARVSAGWVEEGAAKAGRPRPKLYAYVRVALGPDAREQAEAEGERYSRIDSYGSQFERMGASPVETAIAATGPAEVAAALQPWEGVVDAVVLRLLPSAETLEAHDALVRAGAP
jgi:alkanesulfonate monooxygenase SsuD/methylene tetrahydromethanopterin reductase-like flavin-dependent oxidoreductase (luciferase family)